jgi:hypothetical protein
VSFSEGRLVRTTVGRSIVSPDDVGRQVPLKEHCEGNDYDDCTYGTTGQPLLAAGSAALQLFAVVVAMVGTWLTTVAVYNAQRGRRHWWRHTFTPRCSAISSG